MALIVQKFGGTSVADIERIRASALRVKSEIDAGNDVAVVVSAMAGATDRLVAWTREMAPVHDAREYAREYDVVLSAGEQVASGLMALALQNEGIDARSWLAWQIPLRTDDAHGRARIGEIAADGLRRRLAAGQVPVLAGGADDQPPPRKLAVVAALVAHVTLRRAGTEGEDAELVGFTAAVSAVEDAVAQAFLEEAWAQVAAAGSEPAALARELRVRTSPAEVAALAKLLNAMADGEAALRRLRELTALGKATDGRGPG